MEQSKSLFVPNRDISRNINIQYSFNPFISHLSWALALCYVALGSVCGGCIYSIWAWDSCRGTLCVCAAAFWKNPVAPIRRWKAAGRTPGVLHRCPHCDVLKGWRRFRTHTHKPLCHLHCIHSSDRAVDLLLGPDWVWCSFRGKRGGSAARRPPAGLVGSWTPWILSPTTVGLPFCQTLPVPVGLHSRQQHNKRDCAGKVCSEAAEQTWERRLPGFINPWRRPGMKRNTLSPRLCWTAPVYSWPENLSREGMMSPSLQNNECEAASAQVFDCEAAVKCQCVHSMTKFLFIHNKVAISVAWQETGSHI